MSFQGNITATTNTGTFNTWTNSTPASDNSKFLKSWLEFRKHFGPVLLDNSPNISNFRHTIEMRRFGEPEYTVEISYVPKINKPRRQF